MEATDGQIEHIEDLLCESEPWRLEAMVIDTKNWWPGRKVMLAAGLLAAVSWGKRVARVDSSQQDIKGAPLYEPSSLASR